MKIRISTRVVFLTKRRAYKIPLSYRGYLQGKNESIMWNKYHSTGMLAKLRWETLGVVCQDRIPQTSVHSFNAKTFEYNVVKIKRMIEEFNFDNCDLYNIDNWGILNEKYLLLDYGIDEGISKMY